jgi:hypothetical protein
MMVLQAMMAATLPARVVKLHPARCDAVSELRGCQLRLALAIHGTAVISLFCAGNFEREKVLHSVAALESV